MLLKIAINLVVLAFNLLSLFYVSSGNKRLACMFNAMKRLQKNLKGLKQSAVVWQIKTIAIAQLLTFALYFSDISYLFLGDHSLFMITYNIVIIFGRACCGSLMNFIGANFVTICIILSSYLRSINFELENLRENYSTKDLSELRHHSSKIFELANEVNELYGVLLLLILTYHNCYLQIDCFKAGILVYNFSTGRAAWFTEDFSFLIWAFVDGSKALIYIIAANMLENQV